MTTMFIESIVINFQEESVNSIDEVFDMLYPILKFGGMWPLDPPGFRYRFVFASYLVIVSFKTGLMQFSQFSIKDSSNILNNFLSSDSSVCSTSSTFWEISK